MSRWWTPRAISAHVTLAICEPGFGALAWWQVNRALGGNDLSWLYAVEWPFFGVYAVYLWWRIVHDQPVPGWRRAVPASAAGAGGTTDTAAGEASEPARVGAPSADQVPPAAQELDEDPELAAYNRYLARLAAENAPKRW